MVLSEMWGKKKMFEQNQNWPYGLSDAEAKRQMEYIYNLNESAEKAAIEIRKKRELKDIEVEAAEKKAEKLADIAARRALHKTTLMLRRDGEIRIVQECFGANLADTAPFRVAEYALIGTYNRSDEILYISFVTIEDEEKFLFFDLTNLNGGQIKNAFRATGLTFGFGRHSELSMCEKLITALLENAPNWKAPPYHGWYLADGRWKFAFGEMMTWREMKEQCSSSR